jgi:hypothetical protein
MLLALVVLSGCGVSPLLNHVDADALEREREGVSDPCPLRFPGAGLCASLTWEVEPGDQYGEFLLRFWNEAQATAAGPYVDPTLTVAAQLWMPSMNHGSRPAILVTRLDAGVYRATRANFSMPGDWEIRVQLKNGTSVVEQAVFEYEL